MRTPSRVHARTIPCTSVCRFPSLATRDLLLAALDLEDLGGCNFLLDEVLRHVRADVVKDDHALARCEQFCVSPRARVRTPRLDRLRTERFDAVLFQNIPC